MTAARVFGVQFSADADRVLDVRVSGSVGPGRTGTPSAKDFPPDLVAALHTWSAPAQEGVHEDYRVPAKLVTFLDATVRAGGITADVAKEVQRLLKLGPEDQ